MEQSVSMTKIKGITVVLYQNVKIGTDEFNHPIYEEREIEVDNVLVAPSSTNDITTATDLTGKKAVYTLGIPKDDDHEWENSKVRFFDQTFKVLGFSIMGIKENIPLEWNKKVMVEKYG